MELKIGDVVIVPEDQATPEGVREFKRNNPYNKPLTGVVDDFYAGFSITGRDVVVKMPNDSFVNSYVGRGYNLFRDTQLRKV